MKLFTFLLALWPSIIFSQSFPQLVALYEKECAELVNDTIDQHGEIRYELVPVIDQGKILHYALGKPDTIWETPDCPKFKVAAHNGLSFVGARSGIYFGDNISYSTTLGFTPASYPITNTQKAEKTVVKISRKYVCQVKRREVEPFSDHFWDWLKNRKDEQ
jgi:hypothetical protein